MVCLLFPLSTDDFLLHYRILSISHPIQLSVNSNYSYWSKRFSVDYRWTEQKAWYSLVHSSGPFCKPRVMSRHILEQQRPALFYHRSQSSIWIGIRTSLSVQVVLSFARHLSILSAVGVIEIEQRIVKNIFRAHSTGFRLCLQTEWSSLSRHQNDRAGHERYHADEDWGLFR